MQYLVEVASVTSGLVAGAQEPEISRLVQVKLIRAVLARLVEFLEQLFSHLQVWVYIAKYSPFWEALVVIFGVCAACSSWKLIGSSWWGWGSCKSRISGSAVLTRYCCSIWLLLASRPWLSLPASSLTTFSSLLFASWQRLPSLLCLLRILPGYLALQILLHPLLDLFLICQHILSPADGSHRLQQLLGHLQLISSSIIVVELVLVLIIELHHRLKCRLENAKRLYGTVHKAVLLTWFVYETNCWIWSEVDGDLLLFHYF